MTTKSPTLAGAHLARLEMEVSPRRPIVFYRTTDGRLVAAQNRCLHREINELMTAAVDKVFEEDAWAVDHMQKLLNEDHHDYNELVIGGDKAGLLFRRIVLGWVEDEYGKEQP